MRTGFGLIDLPEVLYALGGSCPWHRHTVSHASASASIGGRVKREVATRVHRTTWRWDICARLTRCLSKDASIPVCDSSARNIASCLTMLRRLVTKGLEIERKMLSEVECVG